MKIEQDRTLRDFMEDLYLHNEVSLEECELAVSVALKGSNKIIDDYRDLLRMIHNGETIMPEKAGELRKKLDRNLAKINQTPMKKYFSEGGGSHRKA